MDLPQQLRLATYRFVLRPEAPVMLPAYKGAVLRGGLGYVLKRIVCIYRPTCAHCQLPHTCPYGYLFETTPPEGSTLMPKNADVPVPFVLEPPLDQQREYIPADTLEFHLVLIGKAIRYLPYFIVVFKELGKQGLGAERGRFRLEAVHAVHPLMGKEALVYGEDGKVHEADLAVGMAELAQPVAATELGVNLLTPTRLKYQKEIVHQAPTFEAFVRALLRRVSSLAFFHSGEKWEADFRGWVDQARQVEIVENRTEWVDWERYSTRQKQRMNLGGLVGQVRYAGDLRAFTPLLRLGELVHVGKACAFGHGKYELKW
jgi:CRISPR-associated endoribonuclease Cas6